MSDSTTQQQKKGKAGAGSEKVKIEDNPDEKHPFERDLYKKIRNNEKKLKDIKELEEKVKGNPDFNANEEQKKKIARRETLEREIGEMNHYLDMFRTCMKEDEKNKKDQQVRHQKEVSLAKKQTIRAITNLITLHTLKECGQEIPQEIDEALDAFSLSFDTILNKDQSQFRWRASRDGFVDALSMLAATSKDKLEGMDISPDELNDQIAGLITSGTYPETIESKVLPSGATHHEEAKQSAAAHEAQQEVAHEDEPNAEEAAQEEDNQQDEYDEEAQQEGPHGASAAHGDQAQERDPAIVEQTGEPEEHKGEEAPAEQNPEAENNQADRRGGRGNRRGGGNGRGNRERGDEVNRGERGGDRGERRGRRGDRGRPNTGKRNDEDVEGFRIVEGQDGKNRGGRGRGGRGRGGYYNNNTYRGGRGGRGERGGRGGPNQENGGFNKRGDRGQRARGGRGGRGGEGGDEQPPAEQPAAEQKQAAENNAPADNE